jgi:uncharacterized protein YraI
MRNYMLTAALVAAVLPVTPALAREMNGFVVRSTMMYAGPDYDYPAVQRLRRNSAVVVHGCLRDWNWCDVSNRYDRGWVARRDIVVSYQGRRRGISAYLGLGILSFTFGNYWDSYYRSRPFYSQRPRWEQHYYDSYRPAWGPRPSAPTVTPQPYRPEAAPRQMVPVQPRAVPERRGNQVRPMAPVAPRVAPPVAPPVVAPVRPNADHRKAPGNQGSGQGQSGKDHKQKD